MRTLLSRIRALFQSSGLERRLDEELNFHLDMEAEKQRKSGLTPQEAQQSARRSFGGEQQIKERYRDQRGLPMLELLFKDLQYGFRTMRRSPGFTAIAVISLALGIGANTAIFSLIDAVLLRSLPVDHPDELVVIGDPARPSGVSRGGVRVDLLSYPVYQRLRDQNQVFSGLFASGRTGRLDLKIEGGVEEPVRGRMVSDNFFEVLGLKPSRGRVFESGDDLKPNPVVVVSHEYWQDRFAGDPAIVGRTLGLNGSTFTVVGVGPPGFTGEVVGTVADIWLPLGMQPQINQGDGRLKGNDSHWLLLLGRLKKGITLDRARAEMSTLVIQAAIDAEGTRSLAEDQVREIRALTVNVESGAKGFSGLRNRFRQPLVILMFVVGLVLLIACANIANLLLARAGSRQKEMSVRLAAGASRFRLIRQLLTESILLASIGGCAGVLLAWAGSGLLLQLASNRPTPVPLDVRPDGLMLAFTAGVSILTGLLFGVVPALRSTRIDLSIALKESARSVGGGSGWQLGKLLVVGQVALSLLLLFGAGLFVRSLINLETLDLGYSRSNLILVDTDAIGSGYDTRRQASIARQLTERLRALPGVTGAAVSVNGIFNGTDSTSDSVMSEGFTSTRKEDTTNQFDSIGPQYFQVIGVPLVAGREFDEHDTVGSPPVVILNETMARFYFGDANPIGRLLLDDKDRFTIVGVAKDMKGQDVKRKPERRFYRPFFQMAERNPNLRFEVRTRGDAAQSLAAVRAEIRSFDANLKIASIDSARTLIDQTIVDERLIAQLSGFFGVLALLLAATGLYGIMAYTISRRSNEIGLRMALGADQSTMVGMVLREAFVLVAAGIVIGIPVAIAASQLIASSLSGLAANDPLTLAGATVVMLASALFAAWIPARRAARIDPMVALRQD